VRTTICSKQPGPVGPDDRARVARGGRASRAPPGREGASPAPLGDGRDPSDRNSHHVHARSAAGPGHSSRQLADASGADRASVMLLDQKTDLLIAAAARGSDGPLPAGLRLAWGEGAAGRVIEGAKPLIIPDVRRFPEFVQPHEPETDPSSRLPESWATPVFLSFRAAASSASRPSSPPPHGTFCPRR